MTEFTGNLWDFPADWRGVTTNGHVTITGKCVMGRGCAREAAFRYNNLPFELGDRIRQNGNIVHLFEDYGLFSFPVKHHWQEAADLVLIAKSARQLRALAEDNDTEVFALPRPGCGNGRLHWRVVRPLLLSLPDNVVVIDRDPR